MAKNRAACEAKIERCVKALLKVPTLTVPEAMILARFFQKDMADDSLRWLIMWCLSGGAKGSIEWDSSQTSSTLSPLTADTDNEPAASAGVSMTVEDHIQPPKHEQKRMTVSDVQQKQVGDLKHKKHKSDAHKKAVQLYDKERGKSNEGMSPRQVCVNNRRG